MITIRTINEQDPMPIAQAFAEQGWHKPVELYLQYLAENESGVRVTLIAEIDDQFAGYVNVLWQSYYPAFREQQIPEINDFNVLLKYRRCGIGTRLMDRAEEIIGERSDVAGIGVGLFHDYGQAQILYVKRGYVPDGKGIFNGERYIQGGDSAVIDDDLALYLTKQL